MFKWSQLDKPYTSLTATTAHAFGARSTSFTVGLILLTLRLPD